MTDPIQDDDAPIVVDIPLEPDTVGVLRVGNPPLDMLSQEG